MSPRTMLIAVCALACAGLAAFGVRKSLASRGRVDTSSTVLVVSEDVPRGVPLAATHFESRPFPKELLPPGSIVKAEDAVGRTSLGHLHKGELLMDAKLAAKGSKGGIAGLIPPGMRAIAVQTPNVATGVAGFVMPGNKVDVLITMTGAGRDDPEGTSTIPLLENVEILAVDQKVDAPAENRVDAAQMRSVTLLVTPEQASRLNLGMSRGTLHLSLRNPTDDRVTIAKPATLKDIRPEPEPPPAVAAAPAPLPPPTPPPEPPAPTVPQYRRLRLVRGMIEREVHFHGLDVKANPAEPAPAEPDPAAEVP